MMPAFTDHGDGTYTVSDGQGGSVRIEPTDGSRCAHCGMCVWSAHRCSGVADDLRLVLDYFGRSWMTPTVSDAYDRLRTTVR